MSKIDFLLENIIYIQIMDPVIITIICLIYGCVVGFEDDKVTEIYYLDKTLTISIKIETQNNK